NMWKQDKDLEAQGRVDNIKELLYGLEEFENVGEFLERVSLVSDIETTDQDSMVSIMTLHSAKGLEFDTVFLPGWEEGTFPHQRAIDEKAHSGLEEERRLAYVGITRARKKLYILSAANRRVYGQYQTNFPSRFIDELPKENIEKVFLGNGFNINSYINNYTSNQKPATPSQAISRENKSPEGFAIGQRIFHTKFGYGKVTAISGDQLDIAFEKAGSKKVIDRYVEAV
ncbi:MAG: uvrD, partial [Rickettsiaceae bacterium]|nr:uvrD [Rickettsiaceae bacterium]